MPTDLQDRKTKKGTIKQNNRGLSGPNRKIWRMSKNSCSKTSTVMPKLAFFNANGLAGKAEAILKFAEEQDILLWRRG